MQHMRLTCSSTTFYNHILQICPLPSSAISGVAVLLSLVAKWLLQSLAPWTEATFGGKIRLSLLGLFLRTENHFSHWPERGHVAGPDSVWSVQDWPGIDSVVFHFWILNVRLFWRHLVAWAKENPSTKLDLVWNGRHAVGGEWGLPRSQTKNSIHRLTLEDGNHHFQEYAMCETIWEGLCNTSFNLEAKTVRRNPPPLFSGEEGNWLGRFENGSSFHSKTSALYSVARSSKMFYK